MIGVTVGVSLIFVILIIIIIILVTLFVWRLHHRTGKMIVNPRDSGQEMSAITNPMSKCFVNIYLKLKHFKFIITFASNPCIFSEYVLM